MSVERGLYTRNPASGAKIADDAIDSEHYTDGSIDTAHLGDLQVTTGKIAADAVTSAKIADNAIDSEHYAAGSIDLEHMSSESVDEDNLHISNSPTNGYMLTAQSGDAGGLTWASAGGGRATLIEEVTIGSGTSAEQITGCFSSTYGIYIIEWEKVLPDTNDRNLRIRLLTSTSTSVIANYELHGPKYDSAGTKTEIVHVSTHLDLSIEGVSSNAANNGCSGTLLIYHPDGTGPTNLEYHSISTYSGGGPMTIEGIGSNADDKDITGLEFYANADNLEAGTIRVWGVKA